MKTHFAKYLPVEGEIKEGDYWQHPKGPVFPWTEAYARGPISTGLMKKVKLFLCSRDIKVGDGIKTKCKEEWLDAKVLELPPEYSDYANYRIVCGSMESYSLGMYTIKIIGEISPEATWVKEGDQFDEGEWQYSGRLVDKSPPFGNRKEVEIKGQCGRFH